MASLSSDGAARAFEESVLVRRGGEPGKACSKTMFTHGRLTQGDGLEITVTNDDKGDVVSLNGRINFDSSPALRDRLLDILQGPPPESVFVDLTRVTYIDSSGIATLIEGLKIARNRQTRFCLKGLEGRLLDLFTVTGVLGLFESNGCRSVSPESQVS